MSKESRFRGPFEKQHGKRAQLKTTINFEYFEKKHDSNRFCISEITDSENVVR